MGLPYMGGAEGRKHGGTLGKTLLRVKLLLRCPRKLVNGMGYNLLVNGVYWSYKPLILTIDPNFLGHPSSGLHIKSHDQLELFGNKAITDQMCQG